MAEKVDVLAVMALAALRMEQYAGKANGILSESARMKVATDLDAARAIVAELIGVTKSYTQRDRFQQGDDVGNDPRYRRAMAALDRIDGAA